MDQVLAKSLKKTASASLILMQYHLNLFSSPNSLLLQLDRTWLDLT